MIYTKKTPWTLILGIVMAGYAWLVQQGMLKDMLAFLKVEKLSGEMVTMGFIFGAIGIVVGLWQLLVSHKEGNVDYYRSTVGGALLILMCVFIVKYGAEPLFKIWGAASKKAIGWDFAATLGLNYILLGIVVGIIVVNVFKIPGWAENGVRLSRVGLKCGVILLGALYSAAELRLLGGLSIVLIGFFVLGSVGLVLWLARLRKDVPNSMSGVLSAGMGVCGVSAAVAAAPVVQAKSTEVAYTIGTVLLWGVLMMFIFPPVARMLEMGYVQFGAWAGTGILNSAQVAAAALIYQPDGIDTLKVAEIFNITRVLFLPIIVLWLALWYVKREQTGVKANLGQIIIGKFPLFVLGFILMFALSTTGVFAPAKHYAGKYFDNSEKVLVKKDKEGKVVSKMLKDDHVALLQTESAKLTREDHKAAIARLIENRKVMSEDHDDVVRDVANRKIFDKDATKILSDAHKAVRHDSKRIGWFRNLIIWFFAFGLTGLGMQITFASIKQAGGQPLFIGTIVGTIKAVGSLIVIMLFVKETI
jgi:uncharacterized membrane protein YadS